MKNSYDLQRPDVFDVLSAAWVLSCNDEQPIMTYEGIRYRLRLDSQVDVRDIIRRRGDLFRLGVPQDRLESWKNELRAGRNVPGWIRDIPDQDQRRQAIEALSVDDVFRSQFRAIDRAPRCSLEIIDWGLQHINRLRVVFAEARESSVKSWQMWLVFAVGVMNIVATVVAAIFKR